MDYATSAQTINTGGAGRPDPKTPPTNEGLAQTLGNLERAHKIASDIEWRLFGEPQSLVADDSSMPDAVAWKAHAAQNASHNLAERLAAIADRL